jgi:hypothetical protein
MVKVHHTSFQCAVLGLCNGILMEKTVFCSVPARQIDRTPCSRPGLIDAADLFSTGDGVARWCELGSISQSPSGWLKAAGGIGIDGLDVVDR